MTDVAIDGGGAPAPAESTGAPIPTETATHSTPLGTQTPVAEKPVAPVEDKPPATAMDAIKKANEASESGWKDPETYKVYTDPKQLIKDIEAMLPMLTSGEKEQSDFEAAFGKPTE